MPKMTDSKHISKMYVKNDTLSTRIGLHDKYSVKKYGWKNWVFDQYELYDGIKVLELGCGVGDIWYNRESLPNNSNIVLSDFSPLMVNKAKKILQSNPIFTFEQIDIQKIPYENEVFDIVIANHMLYHVPDQRVALSEVLRVLKPGGYFYITTLGESSLKELEDIYRKLKDKAKFSFSDNITFTLENGANLLTQFFSNIEKRLYIDSLEVTNIEDLIAYIKSYNEIPVSVDDELFELVKMVLQKVEYSILVRNKEFLFAENK